MTDAIESEIHEAEPAMAFSDFLEGTSPGSITVVADCAEARHYGNGGYAAHELARPELHLHCPSDTCNGTMFFRFSSRQVPDIPADGSWHFCYVTYTCSNCRKYTKTFSLAVQRDENAGSGQCYKFGELPEYGPPTPSRLIKLIGPDRELFLKGRRCENQGLGVGAFVYYRRVVESQKNRILDEIIKVSKKLNADHGTIAVLEAAKNETQFSKALGNVKDAVPQALLINGHNPLLLLHSALSDGLHQQTDEHCLELASSIRIVLAELSERLAQALKDEAVLTKALASIMSRNHG